MSLEQWGCWKHRARSDKSNSSCAQRGMKKAGVNTLLDLNVLKKCLKKTQINAKRKQKPMGHSCAPFRSGLRQLQTAQDTDRGSSALSGRAAAPPACWVSSNTSAGRETESTPTFPLRDLCKIMPLTWPEMGFFTELDTINNLFQCAVVR